MNPTEARRQFSINKDDLVVIKGMVDMDNMDNVNMVDNIDMINMQKAVGYLQMLVVTSV